MKRYLILFFFLTSIVASAQDKPKFILSEVKVLDTIIAENTKKYVPSIERAVLDKSIYLQCLLEKPLKDYYAEYNLKEENVRPAILFYHSWNEKLLTYIDTLFKPDHATFLYHYFDPNDIKTPFWEHLINEKGELESETMTSHIDFVLLDRRKKTVVLLLGTKTLPVEITESALNNINSQLAQTKTSAKKILSEGLKSMGYGTGYEVKKARNTFLEENRKLYAQANADQKNTLKGKQVSTISINLANNETFNHRKDRKELIITATLADGRKIETKGSSGIDANWNEYTIEVKAGSFKDGKISTAVPLDEVIANNHKLNLIITPVHQPQLKKEYVFNYEYSNPRSLYFYGYNGENGSTYNSWGGFASKGEDGADGRDGGDGQDGPDVEVYVDLVKDPVLKKELLKCKIVCDEDKYKEYTYVDVIGGKLVIGSQGGRGGWGERGQDGNSSNPCNGYIQSGDGGNGGNGGNGGRGGRVTMYITNKAAKYKNMIALEAPGGYGGTKGGGGSPGSLTNGSGCPSPVSGSRGHDGIDGRNGYTGPKPIINMVNVLPEN